MSLPLSTHMQASKTPMRGSTHLNSMASNQYTQTLGRSQSISSQSINSQYINHHLKTPRCNLCTYRHRSKCTSSLPISLQAVCMLNHLREVFTPDLFNKGGSMLNLLLKEGFTLNLLLQEGFTLSLLLREVCTLNSLREACTLNSLREECTPNRPQSSKHSPLL
mmetsp:Transcript_19829/g.48524  ORF Transcript_19829/g.48524 Transcript_19829/m.48524 type:complete len:164 (-) Transcript_19829:518-1009(-)